MNFPKPPSYYTEFKDNCQIQPFDSFDKVPTNQLIKVFDVVQKFSEFTFQDNQHPDKINYSQQLKLKIKLILFRIAQYIESLNQVSVESQQNLTDMFSELTQFFQLLDKLKQDKAQKVELIRLYQTEIAQLQKINNYINKQIKQFQNK